MDLKACLQFVQVDCNLSMSEKDVTFCYGMSKMTVYDELNHNDNYFKLKFVEFLEFIARLAHLKYRAMADIPLVEKLEMILDDIFFAFGLERNEVITEVVEVSESDNDY